MAEAQGTFSESWYRIAGRRVALRPHVRLHRQYYRGEKWFVLHDPFANQFFRLRPAAYAFVARLARDRTVQEVWEECLRLAPDDAPGQQEVIRLLAQLFHANLIQSDQPADSASLFERYRKRRLQETRARLLNIMFASFHLFDPDRLLVRLLPVVRPLFGPLGAVVWLVAVAAGLKAVVDHAGEFMDQTEAVLAPGNLVLLYVALVLLKTLHEFGHAFMCRRFGGEVHDMGVMLLIFTPLPYVNATAAWAFRERWKRVLVGLAGMLVELFVAALAAVVWAGTGPGLVHSLAYNTVFFASVSTILFNANPLLRYDGYYVLSDLLDLPNLFSRSMQMWKYLVERFAFGIKPDAGLRNPAQTPAEARWLTFYGILTLVYRVFVFAGILMFVGSRFLLVGLLMAVVCAFSWVVAPLVRLVHYVAASPGLYRVRARAALVLGGTLLAVLTLLGAVPWRVRVLAPGVVLSARHTVVATETAGRLAELLARPGTQVRAGVPLVRLEAPELDFAIAAARAQQAEVEALLRQAMDVQPANLQPLRSSAAAVRARLADLETRRAGLTVCARQDGLWVAPNIAEQRGGWVARGAVLGDLVDPTNMLFAAVIDQQDAARLFGEPVRAAAVRLAGEAGIRLRVAHFEARPGERYSLPHPALGWSAGGEVAVDLQDRSGVRTREPVFEVRAALPADGAACLTHGRTGRMSFDFAPQPLLIQWSLKLRQLVQKRYQL